MMEAEETHVKQLLDESLNSISRVQQRLTERRKPHALSNNSSLHPNSHSVRSKSSSDISKNYSSVQGIDKENQYSKLKTTLTGKNIDEITFSQETGCHQSNNNSQIGMDAAREILRRYEIELEEANQSRKTLQQAVDASNRRVADLTEQVNSLRRILDNQHKSFSDMQGDVVFLQFQAEE